MSARSVEGPLVYHRQHYLHLPLVLKVPLMGSQVAPARQPENIYQPVVVRSCTDPAHMEFGNFTSLGLLIDDFDALDLFKFQDPVVSPESSFQWPTTLLPW